MGGPPKTALQHEIAERVCVFFAVCVGSSRLEPISGVS